MPFQLSLIYAITLIAADRYAMPAAMLRQLSCFQRAFSMPELSLSPFITPLPIFIGFAIISCFQLLALSADSHFRFMPY